MATFARILAAPLQSALIKKPLAVLYNPRSILEPDGLVESMGGIIRRTSVLDPDVRLSEHPAPDVLGFRVCPCADGHDSFRESLSDYSFSSWHGSRPHDEDVLAHP